MVIATIAFLGVALISLREMALNNGQLRDSFGRSCSLTLQVKTDPVSSQAKVIGSYRHDSHFSFLATALRIRECHSEISLRLPVRVIADSRVRGLLPGQKLRVWGTVEKTSEARVAALVLVRKVQVVGKPSSWSSTLGQIRSSFREIAKGGDSGALIPGMVLGDTSLQSQEFTNAMRKSGLAHLTAVSGANFALVAALLLWLSQWIVRRIWLRMMITGFALLSFIALVRPSPSVLRAAAMAAVILLARGTGRHRESIPALGFAIASVILIDPWQCRDPGFSLSVLATAGLLLLSPVIYEKLTYLLPLRLAEALAPPISAIALCTPILVAISGFLAPISIVANVLAAPLVAPITVIGFIAALLAPLWASASGFLVYIIKFPASAIVMIAKESSRFPVITTGNGLRGFLLTLLAACGIAFGYKKWRRSALVFGGALLLIISSILWLTRWPQGDWTMANCNVGQGDSLVINLGAHRAIAIDVGPDAALEERCLRSLGVREIPLLVLTHFHADHVGGLSGLIKNRKIGQVWISQNLQPEIESRIAFNLLSKLPIYQVHKGDHIQVSTTTDIISIHVLWPDFTRESFGSVPGSGSEINNSSIALSITAPNFSLFAGGDIEPQVQSLLLPLIHRVDIYKVSHHGSRYQSEEFMAQLSPKISLISVGRRNPYGHPATETIAPLTRLGSKIFRTDRDGNVAIKVAGNKIVIKKTGG